MTTVPDASQALRELADDVRDLRIVAIDSPAYKHGARDLLAAVLDLIDNRVRHVRHGVLCGLPDCHRTADPANGMCVRHAAVRVSGSFVDDNHLEGGHG